MPSLLYVVDKYQGETGDLPRMDAWAFARFKKVSSAKGKWKRSLNWQVRTSERSRKGLLVQWKIRSNTVSLTELTMRFWGLWTQHRIKSTLPKIPKWSPFHFELPGWKQKSFSLPFHCILNMPHPAVTLFSGVRMNFIHLRSCRWSTNQKHPPFFIGYFSYNELLKRDYWRLLVLGRTVTTHIKVNVSLIKYHTSRRGQFFNWLN